MIILKEILASNNEILSSNNHLTPSFDFFLNRIKGANNRTELFSLFNELPKLFSIAEPAYLHLLTKTFLQKLTLPLFGYITEADFNTLFRDVLFLRSPYPATSLWALICFLSQCNDGGYFQFSKCITLTAEVQRPLLQKALTNGKDSEDAYQFAFVLSSFASRVYNFFGDNKSLHLRRFSYLHQHSSLPLSSAAFNRTTEIISDFEENLLGVLLDMAENPPSQLDMPMFTHIFVAYGTASAGGEQFIRRFFTAALCNPKTHFLLRQVFARNSSDFFHRAESRRNWEAMIRIVVTMATNSRSLELFFGDSVHADEYLRRFLIEWAALVPSSFDDRGPRNSEKVADLLALSAPAHSSMAFQTHVQLFIDRCKVVEMAPLHLHFVQALAVIDFARRLEPEQRCFIRDQLIFSLVPIVPQMIEIADCSRRQIGLLTAQMLFDLFEFPSPPQFDFDESDPMLREFRAALQLQQTQNGTEKNHEDEREGSKAKMADDKRDRKRISPGDARVAVLLDSDDDEETEGQWPNSAVENERDYEEEDASSSDRPAYLRDCLEILSPPNPNNQTVKTCHWIGAFRAIPQMLRKRSIGWNILGGDLMETVLQLDNRYNLSDFGEIRAEILKFLLAQSPELIPNAFRKIVSRCCPMSRRFFLLRAVVDAAKMLANGDGEGANAKENTTNTKEKQMEREKEGKIIRKSVTLQRQHNKLQENAFSRVAPQFVFPLLHFNQFDLFHDATQSNVFLGQLALALGELIKCAAYSPSILSILSSSFAWLTVLRRFGAPRHPFVLRCCIGAYLAICDSFWPSMEMLRENFADELRECHEWLEEMKTDFLLGDMEEAARQSIGMLSAKIVNVLKS